MEPTLFSNTIQLSNEVTYLWPTLDKGLTWKQQLDKVTNACRAFWMCSGTFGKTWGLKPKVMHWIYTMVVRPMSLSLCGGLGSNSRQARFSLANCKGWPLWALLEQWKQLNSCSWCRHWTATALAVWGWCQTLYRSGQWKTQIWRFLLM
jgi:hypothetical protein